MSTDSELRDSIERTKQAFRSGQEELPPAPGREEAPRVAAQASTSLHPFFRGLIESLPEPGADWPQNLREQWLETARNIFGLVFTDSEQRDSRPAPGAPPLAQFERKSA